MLYHFRPDANKFAGVKLNESDVQKHPLIKPLILHVNCFPIVQLYHLDVPLLPDWKPPRVELFEDNPPREGDFPSLSNFWNVPLCSERAWHVLRPLIGDVCEALPVLYPTGKPYYIIHVMRTTDCLDASKSTFYARSDGKIVNVYVYAIKEEILKNEHVFKLPSKSGGDLIVDDVFRDAVQLNRLKGLLFPPLIMAGTPAGDEMCKKVAIIEQSRDEQK